MAYQVIARKWRPQTFDEVTGQEAITRTLRNAIEHQRLHHAYLFSGARGVGKTTTARLLAKALNCHKAKQPTPTPCRTDAPDQCPSCLEITDGRSIDVQEIDAASNTGIDNVRETIIGTIGFAPARDRFKIFIIDEVHMLSGASFNALLKTVEEPPKHVVFIMATTEKHKVPETILSRCQQFEFRTIATAKIVERLKLIARAENISLPDDAVREIARSGEGSMRDAQSAMDQVITFAGNKVKKQDVELALGLAGPDIITRIIDAVAENKPAAILAVIDDVVMRGHDLRNFCRDLLAHFRDLLVTKVSGSEELLESAVCEPEELQRQAALFSESDLVRFFHSLAETETKLKTASHPRYQIEIGIVKLMELRQVESITELLDKLAQLEATIQGNPTVSPSTPRQSPTATPVKQPNREQMSNQRGGVSTSVAATAPALQTQSVDEREARAVEASQPLHANASTAEQIKAALERQRKMFLVTVLDAALSTSIEDGELFIEFAPDARHFRDTLARTEHIKLLRDACEEVTGKEMGVRIAIRDVEATAPPTKEDEERLEKKSLREGVESNPIVQEMLKTFRGEIVDVRKLSDKV